MSAFSPEWLALREPYDAESRNPALVETLASHFPRTDAAEIVDLATGTGANLRYLAPRIGGAQRWTVVDRDAQLLAAIAPRLAEWAERRGYRFRRNGMVMIVSGDGFEAEVRLRQLDLARDLDRAVHENVRLVTAAALLDLVSEDWLGCLANACRSAGARILFALTYDGETAWSPADAEDGHVLDAVNRHQRTDKGFGAALGPDAARRARALYRTAGYRVTEAKSDWDIGPAAHAMQHALLDGWRKVAAERSPERAGALAAWAMRRAAAIEQGISALRVGHVDLAGWPE